jgi:uncharacterized membrane protein YkvA (DUF1232 family)
MRLKNITIGKVLKYLGRAFRRMGQQAVYSVMLMVYAYRSKEAPAWAKRIIIGTLGYVLTPIDAVPDLSPLIGYTDDIGVLTFGLVTIASYINDEVRISARRDVKKLFGEIDLASIQEVDSRL